MESFHYSRRLLLPAIPPLYHSDTTMAPPPAAVINHNTTDSQSRSTTTFDVDVILVLSVLVCSLICSLLVNFIIKCAFKCSSYLLSTESSSSNHPSLANRGIKKKALETFPVITYSTAELKHPGFDSECVICLSEFGVGEKVKILPKCNHGFHVRCIDKWLKSNTSCPSCRNCLSETCQKIVNGGSASSTTIEISSTSEAASNTSSSAPIQEIVLRIEPLKREGVTSSSTNQNLVEK